MGLSIQSFIEDKIAFVYENDDLNSRKLSAEILLLLEKVKSGTEGVIFQALIDRPDSLSFSFVKDSNTKDIVKNFLAYNFDSVCSEEKNLSLFHLEKDAVFLYCAKTSEGSAIYGIEEDKIMGIFGLRGLSDSVLVGLDGRVISGPALYKNGKKISDIVGPDIEKAFGVLSPDQTRFEIINKIDQNKYLVNYYRILWLFFPLLLEPPHKELLYYSHTRELLRLLF